MRPTLVLTLTLLLLAATALAGGPSTHKYEYQPPPHNPAARPCPNLKSPRRIMVDGRPAFEFQTMMNVDVDGAPTAYGPHGKKTLDDLKHAYAPHSRQVVGYMTEYEGGPPTIQGPNDPAPGFYVSQTDLADPAITRKEDPRRYLDATTVNYLVLGDAAEKAGVQLGDFALVYSCRTGRTVVAIVGDSGNPSGAEGSLALVRALGYDIRDGREDSVDDPEILIRYFPHSNPDKHFFHTQQQLNQGAAQAGLRP